MTPGEYFIKDGEIEFNQGLEKTVITVKNVGDRPIQVGSHYHFYEVNPSLVFDKEKAFSSILLETNMRERENIIQKIELINSILNKNQKTLDISILYTELFLANCFVNNINIYNSEVHYEKNSLSLIVENDTPQLKKSAEISEFFESLSRCHNVKHELHGYDGFYHAEIEYVVYNLLNNLIHIQLPGDAIAPETEFYSFGLDYLMNFIKLYKSVEI